MHVPYSMDDNEPDLYGGMGGPIMIDIIHKIHTSPNDPHSLFAEVTIDSIANNAILIGYNFTDSRTVVYSEDVDSLIESLQLLKTKYL